MRFINYSVSGTVRLGCTSGNTVLDINGFLNREFIKAGYERQTAERMACAEAPNDLGELLGGGAAVLKRLKAVVARVAKLPKAEQAALRAENILCDADKISYLPPLAGNATIFAVGRNYADHVAEAGSKAPSIPAIFMRTHNSVVGHGEALLRPRLSHHFDWEVELAVVIGQHCRHVTKKGAYKVIAGYTTFNDGSLRDYQKAAPMLTAGKNFLRSGAMGPSIVTADEVRDPQDMTLRTLLNGKVMQNANTKDMLFNIADIIAYLTQWTPLRPGDVIATGTPAGVGFSRKPPIFLKPGDKLRMEIGNLDPLVNTVVDEES